MSGHRIEKCKHGTLVLQCRCMGPKPVYIVVCPKWCPTPDASPAVTETPDA